MEPEKKKTVPFVLESTFTTRGALRAVTVLVALCMLYFAAGKAWKAPAGSAGNVHLVSAMLSVFAINLLSAFFAFFHAILPDEVADMRSRISGRSLIRGLSMTACAGCVLVGQYAGWGVHDYNLAFTSTVLAMASWIIFAVIYVVYCRYVPFECRATASQIFKNGSGHGSLVTMALITALSLLLTGLATGSTQLFLPVPLFAAVSAVIFTLCILFFQRRVHPDDDFA